MQYNMKMILYHNKNCSKSRECLSILSKEKVNFKVRDYMKENLTLNEIKHLVENLKSDLKERIFLKLITNKSNDKVVGLHYLGENAAEIIQGFSVALVKGLKKRDFDKTVGIHPSSAEEIVTLKN